MDFQLPKIDKLDISEETEVRRIKSESMRMRKKMGLKLNSMPLKETKLLTDIKNSYKIEDYYTTLSVIGSGTYAKVYLAVSKKDGSRVAIKMSRGNTSCEFLKQEYDLLQTLDDPIIPKPIEYQHSVVKNASYLVMEYFPGQSLDSFLEQHGTLEEEVAMN